mmetsp:Transcript_2058/g.3158  ORF Transcript_2058/g.3158 Transcript_2058/m.3158 type:complete len:87 (-) Transcript_2058:708-968(-)
MKFDNGAMSNIFLLMKCLNLTRPFFAINCDFDGTSCLQQLVHRAEYGVSFFSSAKPGQRRNLFGVQYRYWIPNNKKRLAVMFQRHC